MPGHYTHLTPERAEDAIASKGRGRDGKKEVRGGRLKGREV